MKATTISPIPALLYLTHPETPCSLSLLSSRLTPTNMPISQAMFMQMMRETSHSCFHITSTMTKATAKAQTPFTPMTAQAIW